MRSLFLFALLLFPACRSTHAAEPDPPVQMTAVDAARLDKIDPAQFGKTVAVDFATGKIERRPAK